MKGKGWIIAGIAIAAIGGAVWYGLQPSPKSGLPRALEEGKEYIAPLVQIEKIRMTNLDLNTMVTEVTVGVRNRMPLPFRIDSLRYTTYLEGGTVLASGVRKQPLALPKSDSTAFTLPMMVNLGAMKSFSGRDSVDYTVRTTLFTDLPFTRDSALTVTMNFRWLILRLPEVSLVDVGKVDPGLRRVGMMATYEMRNPNKIAFRMTNVRYRMTIDDGEVVSEGRLAESVDLPAGGADRFSIPMEMRTPTLLKAAVKEKARRYHSTTWATLSAEGIGSTDVTMNVHGRLKDMAD